MSILGQVAQADPGPGARQGISILFNAAALAQAAMSPPFKTQISGQAGSYLDVITVDATMQEVHTFSNEVTEHPVEQGANIADHIRRKPIEVRLSGIISETPLDTTLADAAVRSIPGLGIAATATQSVASLLSKSAIVRDAYNTLRAMRDAGQLVVLWTPYRAYTSMAITDLQITRDTSGGEALQFTATFREVLTVESASTIVQQPTLAQSALEQGEQPLGAASKKIADHDSALLKVLNGGQTLDKPGGTLDSFARRVGYIR